MPSARARVGGVRGVLAADIAAGMTAHALAPVEDLDGAHARAHVDDLVHERVRDGVVVPVQLDVVVDVDAGRLPLPVDERLGGARAEDGPVHALEELAAAGAGQTRGAVVQIGEPLGDAGVESR